MPRRLTEEQMLELLLGSDIDELSDEGNDAEEEISAESDSEESEDELIQSEESESPALLPLTNTRPLKWFCKPEGISAQLSEEPTWEIDNRQLWSPFTYFSEYFDDKVWALVSEQSNRYALQKGISLNSTLSEYKRLVGAHIIAGCMKLPQIRMYYRPQIRVPAITQIPRDRLFKLRNNIHFVDNMAVTEKEKENKLWKVQPVIDVVLN